MKLLLVLGCLLPPVIGLAEIKLEPEVDWPQRRLSSNSRDIPSSDSCNRNNVIFDTNLDGTIDIVFLDFLVETTSYQNKIKASCQIELPVRIPQGFQTRLTQLSLEGTTEVPRDGFSQVVLTQFIEGGRKNIGKRNFYEDRYAQDVRVRARSDDWTTCGDQSVLLNAEIAIVVQNDFEGGAQTVMEIDEGAANRTLRYSLDYRRCSPKDW